MGLKEEKKDKSWRIDGWIYIIYITRTCIQNFIQLLVPLSDSLKIAWELPNSAGVSSCNPGWHLNTDYGTKWVNGMNSVFKLFCYIHLFKNLLLLHNKGNFPSEYYYIDCFTPIAMKVTPTEDVDAPAFESTTKS